MKNKDIISFVIGIAIIAFVYWLLFFALAPQHRPKIFHGHPIQKN